MRSRFTAARALGLLAVAFLCGATPVANGGGGGDDPAVYLKVVDATPVAFQTATVAIMDALTEKGWDLVADFATAAPSGRCAFRSEVMVAVPPGWAARVMKAGTYAAFAVPIRFVIWEDENGVSVGATNPMNLARTIVDEETAPEDWADIASEIRAVGAAALPSHASEAQYGQQRRDARIGRTMGIMAGGKFTDKVKTVATVSGNGTDPSSVAHRLADALVRADTVGEWGAALVGITGAKMEADAFHIVKNGGDDGRKKMACPGIDHAAAFPIELLVTRDGDDIRVALVDEMYRMKMFFEDAGKMAFAKNMGMPGSIEDEISKKVEGALH
jgi:uncharacterized protein (DUF302 family)